MQRGLLIVFAGNNGSGKTTLINTFINKLNNKESKLKLWNTFKYPNRSTVLGKKIDDFLKNKIHLTKELELKFFADNRKESQLEIINLLKNGYNVVCDRYVYCSLAYTITNQTLSIKNHEMINILSLDDILKYDSKLLKPDHVFLIRGEHLELRNEIAEKYHKGGVFNDLLLNNYILSFKHTKTAFTIVENTFEKLNDTSELIINKIQNINKNRIENKIYDDNIQNF